MPLAWRSQVDDHDYAAARDYLSLRLSAAEALRAEVTFRNESIQWRRANDILRACDREPLPASDPGVRRAAAKLARGKKLSPVLLASFDFGGDIADGYHRVSLAYRLDPFTRVPCKIASL